MAKKQTQLTEEQTRELDRLNGVLDLLMDVKSSCSCSTYDAEIQKTIKEIEDLNAGKVKVDAVVEDIVGEVTTDEVEQGNANVEVTPKQSTKDKKTSKEVAE